MATELRHGTATGYTYGCRCDLCRAAHAHRLRKYNARKRTEKKLAERRALIAEIVAEYQAVQPQSPQQEVEAGA